MSDAQTENQSKVSQVKANPTMSTLDAIAHERDLESERQRRKDSTIVIPSPATELRKAGMDNGNKMTGNAALPSDIAGDDYQFKEGLPKAVGKPSPTPVIESGA